MLKVKKIIYRQATLKDLYKELERRGIIQTKKVWITKDGTKINIEDMSDTHLLNAINLAIKHQNAHAMFLEAGVNISHEDWYK